MKRSIRWYLAWGTMVASLSMLFFIATAGPALAWSQEENDYSDTGSGSGQCGTKSSQPCLYWKEPANTSVKLYFYVDPALANVGGYNFTSAISWGFNQWNGAPAWNPYMEWDSGNQDSGLYRVAYSGELPCVTLGRTSYDGVGLVEYGYNPQRGGNEYYAFMGFTTTIFNPIVQWNSSETYASNCAKGFVQWDARNVTTHESGHVQGMGHTSLAAIMLSGSQYIDLQGEDKAGIAAIYPGNQQHT